MFASSAFGSEGVAGVAGVEVVFTVSFVEGSGGDSGVTP